MDVISLIKWIEGEGEPDGSPLFEIFESLTAKDKATFYLNAKEFDQAKRQRAGFDVAGEGATFEIIAGNKDVSKSIPRKAKKD